MDTFAAGFRPSLDQVAMAQQQSAMLDLPGKLPAASTYIAPDQMTQATGTQNPMPMNNLPLNELGLGLKDAQGNAGGSANPFIQTAPGSVQIGTGVTAEMQEAQLKAMEQQQQLGQFGGAASGALTGAKLGSMVLPGIGTAVGAVVGGVAGWLLGND